MCLNMHMKSFTRIKNINGQEYIYEITPYYDKEKKQIRQKSKYLGKNVNGVPVKIRSHLTSPGFRHTYEVHPGFRAASL